MPPSSRVQGQPDAPHNQRTHGQQQQQHAGQQAAPAIGPAIAQDYFTVANDATNLETKRYTVLNLIGKGSYGVVCAARDNVTGEVVAIKKIQNVFDNVADAHRILREITLLRLLKHPDIVEIKHIMLPADPNKFKDLYVVFELMESDLHTVIGANDDLTRDHHKVFLYQLLRGLNFMHTNRVLHRDLKPKNILANSNCKLKICDFGLARPCMGRGASAQSPVIWTDYVATRWYRAPELCGCFYGQYNGAVDMWSIGCIFAEVLQGKPLFPGKDAASQLTLITDLLGKPPAYIINSIPNAKARKWLHELPDKKPKCLSGAFPKADPKALDLLARMLAFDPADRPTAAAALAHPYFAELPSAVAQEAVPVLENFPFENFDRLTEQGVRHLIYREVLNYHPQVMAAFEKEMAWLQHAELKVAAVLAGEGGVPGSSGSSAGAGGLGAPDSGRLPVPLDAYNLASSTPADSVSLQFMFQNGIDGHGSQESADSLDSEVTSGPTAQQMQQLQQPQQMQTQQMQQVQQPQMMQHQMQQMQQQQVQQQMQPLPPPGFPTVGYGAAPQQMQHQLQQPQQQMQHPGAYPGSAGGSAASAYNRLQSAAAYPPPPAAYGAAAAPPPPSAYAPAVPGYPGAAAAYGGPASYTPAGAAGGYSPPPQGAYYQPPPLPPQPQPQHQQASARAHPDALSQYQDNWQYAAAAQQAQQQQAQRNRTPQAPAHSLDPRGYYGGQMGPQHHQLPPLPPAPPQQQQLHQLQQQQHAQYLAQQQQQQLQQALQQQQQQGQGTPRYEPHGSYAMSGGQYYSAHGPQ